MAGGLEMAKRRVWTPEMDKDLTLLVDHGLSCPVIADRLSEMYDDKITKNAVIGRAGRLCLQHARSPRTSNSGSGGKQKRSLSSRGQNGAAARKLYALHRAMAENDAPPTVPALPVPEINDETAPASLWVGLLDLTDKTCRWPIGDPRNDAFHFCGHQTLKGASYCSHHDALSRDSSRRKPVYVPERLLGKRAA